MRLALGGRDGPLEGGGRHALAEAAGLEPVDLHGLLAPAQLQPRQQPEAAAVLAVQSLDHLLGAQGLVVAGTVEQARGHVDGVAEAVAVELHDLPVGDRHLQLERGQPGPAAARGVGDDALERIVHVVGGLDASGGAVEHGHQAVAERLDDDAAGARHDLAHQRDALRHHRGRLGVAERLVQPRAAAQVGEQHGAFDEGSHRWGRDGVASSLACTSARTATARRAGATRG